MISLLQRQITQCFGIILRFLMHSAIFLKIDNFLTMGENITTWIQSGQGFESGWMSVELLCYVKTIVFL